jgi:hypothetical protein
MVASSVGKFFQMQAGVPATTDVVVNTADFMRLFAVRDMTPGICNTQQADPLGPTARATCGAMRRASTTATAAVDARREIRLVRHPDRRAQIRAPRPAV